MNVDQIKSAIASTPKGCNIIVEWLRNVKTRKGVVANITKAVRMVGRMGIDYDNLAAVQSKRESGELPSENQGLPFGYWIEAPYLIGHVKKDETKETTYLRLYSGTSNKVHPSVAFFKDGKETTLRELEPAYFKAMDDYNALPFPKSEAIAKAADKLLTILPKSEVVSEHGDCFCCKTEDITRLNNEAEYVLLVSSIEQEKIAVPIPAAVLATI